MRREGEGEEDRRTWQFLLLWFLVLPVFTFVDAYVELQSKPLFFTRLPMAMFGGVAITWLWRRGRAGQVVRSSAARRSPRMRGGSGLTASPTLGRWSTDARRNLRPAPWNRPACAAHRDIYGKYRHGRYAPAPGRLVAIR